MNIFKVILIIFFSVLFHSCLKEQAQNEVYDENKAFNLFLQTEFPHFYKKKRGFKEVNLEDLKKSGVCRIYNDLDFQVIYFCPFYQICYQIIHDIKQRKFYVQKNRFKEPYVKIIEEQLDSHSNQTYYISEEEKHPYHLISKILNDRYGKSLMPKEAFEELATFLSTGNRGSVSVMKKEDIIEYYNEKIEEDCIDCRDSKQTLDFKNIFKQQMNYVYSKMNNDYFVTIKNSSYTEILIFELKIDNPYIGLEPWFNEAEIEPTIRYSLDFKTYPIYH